MTGLNRTALLFGAAFVTIAATPAMQAQVPRTVLATQPSSMMPSGVAPSSVAPSSTAPSGGTPAGAGPASAVPTTAPADDGQPVTILEPATQPTTAAAKHISMYFVNAPIDTVLMHLSDAAGFRVIKEGQIDGRVNIIVRQPVTSDEAIDLLNSALKPNGYTAIQMGRVLKIVTRDKARHQNIPVYFGADPSKIAETDELITQVIPISNIDATKLRQDLTPLIGTDADVAANQGSNSILITDTSANIKRVVQIISRLDQHQAGVTDMRVVHLDHASADSAVKLITSVFPNTQSQQSGGQNPFAGFRQMMRGGRGGGGEGGGGGGIEDALHSGKVTAAADDRTNTLVVTGPTETLKLIDGLLKVLDSDESAQADIKVFTLKYADADSAAKLVTSIFKPDTTSSQNNESPFSRFRGGRGQSNQSEAGGAVNQALRGGEVNAVADDRTNTVVVTAPSPAMKLIEGVLRDLDSNPATQQAYFIYNLKNGQAANLEPVLNTLFGNSSSGSSTGNRTGTQSRTNSTSAFGSSNGGRSGSSGLGGSSAFGGSSSGFGSSGSSRTSGGTGIGARRGTQSFGAGGAGGQLSSGAMQAASSLTGQVYVVANQDTNSLLIATAAKYQDQVRQIITELDRPVPQVLIKVLVAEVTHDNSSDLGTDFSILNQRVRTNADGTTTTLGQTGGYNFGNAAAGASPAGGLVVQLTEANVNATLHALASVGKLDVLSRPYILASDNQEATITVGQEVPFITNTRLTDTGQTINTIQYQDVGIILDVTPHINPDGLVILDVAPEISQLTGTTVPIGDNVNAPVIAKRSAQSRVGIKNGQTIVIGGLMEDRKTLTVNKIPLLGDIPFIGPVFSRTQTDKTKTELLIFLTPHVALQPDTLEPMSQDEMRGTKLTTRAVEPGVFEEHMRGMQRGATGGIETTRPSEPVKEFVIPPDVTTRPFMHSPGDPPPINPAAPATTASPPAPAVQPNRLPQDR